VGRYIIVHITTNCTSAEIQVVINSTVEETMSHHKESNMYIQAGHGTLEYEKYRMTEYCRKVGLLINYTLKSNQIS
jgi:hypothetical protein